MRITPHRTAGQKSGTTHHSVSQQELSFMVPAYRQSIGLPLYSTPNPRHLRVFRSCVCVQQTGERRAKLDYHHFDGIFIGYTVTNQNIRYINIASSVVKQSHHAVFDKVWYLQPTCPPAAQLLYDLGLEEEVVPDTPNLPTFAMYPPLPCLKSVGPKSAQDMACQMHLPLCESVSPVSYGA